MASPGYSCSSYKPGLGQRLTKRASCVELFGCSVCALRSLSSRAVVEMADSSPVPPQSVPALRLRAPVRMRARAQRPARPPHLRPARRRRRVRLELSRFDPVFVTRGDKIERSYRVRTYVWNVGHENVILAARGLASKALDSMDRAMGGSNPSSRSFARRVP